MKICYLGTSAVDILGRDRVEPLEVIEVSDELGASLLTAGATFTTADGVVTMVPPAAPLWRAVDQIVADVRAASAAVDEVIAAAAVVVAVAGAAPKKKRRAAGTAATDPAPAEKES